MKILFISDRFPIPPKDGVSLPLAKIMEFLSEYHEVNLLVIGCNRSEIDQNSIPKWINKIHYFKSYTPSTYKTILDELFINKPTYFNFIYDENEIYKKLKNEKYDILWATPVGLGSFIDKYEQVFNSEKFIKVLGVNDAKYSQYWEWGFELLTGRVGWDKKRLLRLLRQPFIYLNEKKYLNRYDILHVQTQLEKKKLEKITNKDKIIAAQNGIKEELLDLNYDGLNSNKILYMTHLRGDRKNESKWFLEKVWPKIYNNNSKLELLLVGTPPSSKYRKYLKKIPNLNILGFVDDIRDVYSSVKISVVPIYHSTGLINRVLDSLCAGVPVVGMSNPLKTINGLVLNKHAIAADDPNEMANKILEIMEDRSKIINLSKKGRELALKQPTWEDNIEHLENFILKKIENN